MNTPPVNIVVTPVGSHLLVECSACGPVGVFPSTMPDRDLHASDHSQD